MVAWLYVLWIAAFPFIPLLPNFQYGSLDAEGPRWVWLNAGIIFLLGWVAFETLLRGRRIVVKNRLALILVVAFLCWMILTSLFGFNAEQSFWGSLFRHQGLLTYFSLGILFFCAPLVLERWTILLPRILTLSTFILGLTVLSEVPALEYAFLRPIYAQRLLGPFGQPNFLAEYLVFLLPLHIFLLETLRGWRRVVPFCSLFLSIGIVFATFSRTGFVGLAVVFVWWIIKMIVQKRLTIPGLLFLLGPTILLIFLFLQFPLLEAHRARFFQELQPENLPAKLMTEHRGPIWSSALRLWSLRPLTGWGMENMGEVLRQRPLERARELTPLYVDRAHSYLLDLAIGGGLPVLVLFLALLILAVKSGQIGLSSHFDSARRAFFVMSIGAFTAMSLVNIPSLSLLVILWTFLGLVSRPLAWAERSRSVSMRKRLLFVAVFSWGLLGFIFLVLRPHLAGRVFRAMEQSVKTENFSAAQEHARKAVILFPYFSVYRDYERSFVPSPPQVQ
ncbi:MAG: O-antigen ligase family protein [bacterium]|nr:O-antigen ligase family protein [bacterium]